MTLTRQQLDDLLVDYLYDELDPETTRAFEAAVAAHPDLSAEVAAHQRTREASQALPSVAVPAGLLDGVLAEARASAARAQAAAEPSKPWWVRLFVFVSQPAVATAALACLVLGVGVLVLDDGDLKADRAALQKAPPRVERAVPPPAPEPEAAAAAKVAGAPVPLGPSGVAAGEDAPAEEPAVDTVTEPANVAVAAPTRADESPTPQTGLGNTATGSGAGGGLGLSAKAETKANTPAVKAPRRAANTDKKKVDASKGDAPAAGRVANDLDGVLDNSGQSGGSSAPVYRPAPAATPAPSTPGARPPVTTADSAKDAGGARTSGSRSKAGGADQGLSDSFRSGSGAAQPAPAPAPPPVAPSADPAPTPASPAPDAPADRALPEVAIPVPGSNDDAAPAKPSPSPSRAPAPKPAEERVQREALDEQTADREEQAETEEEKQEKRDDARVSALWRDYDKAVAAGDWTKAEKILDQIAAIPAQKQLAAERRKQLASRRKKASGGSADRATSAPQPAAVPTSK